MTYQVFLPNVSAPKKDLLIGTCLDNPSGNTPEEIEFVLQHFDLVCPENCSKYSYVSEHGYERLDSLVRWSIDYGKEFHGVALVWWDKVAPDPSEYAIKTINRNPSGMDYTVVNEGWHDDGRPTMNIDIPKIYQDVRRACKGTRLWYNGLLTHEPEQVQAIELLEQGLIDGIGIEGHLYLGFDLYKFNSLIEEIESLGGKWRISELDIRVPVPPSELAKNLQKQLFDRVHQFAKGSNDLTMWGISDRHSWIPRHFPSEGYALPIDENLQRKVDWI